MMMYSIGRYNRGSNTPNNSSGLSGINNENGRKWNVFIRVFTDPRWLKSGRTTVSLKGLKSGAAAITFPV